MGYQLWTSPITGYRRRGTRAAELRSLFERGVTATSILEPLRCCKTDDHALTVADEMRRLGFDVVGLLVPGNSQAMGFVSLQDLTAGNCEEHRQLFQTGDLISDSMALIDLLSVFSERERVFVLVGNKVAGIVTRADLQKPPVRILLFGLLSLFEMHLSYWVKLTYPDDTWRAKLKEPRLKAARKLWRQRKARNEEMTEFDCLQFCDKRDLAVNKESIRRRLGLDSKKKAAELLRRAERLRDKLAHSQIDLETGDSWRDIITVVKGIEKALHASDESIEKDASTSGRPPALEIAV